MLDDNATYQEELKQYSLEELVDIAQNIDREKAPERFRMVVAEIKKRRESSSQENKAPTAESEMKSGTRPIGLSILAFFYFAGGIGMFALQITSGGRLFQGFESIGGSGLAGIIGLLFIAVFGVVGGIGMWAGKKWGWWAGVLYLFHSVLRNTYVFAMVPQLVTSYGAPEQGVKYYYFKFGARVIIHSLIALYFFTPKVNRYFKLEENSAIKRLILVTGIAICLLVPPKLIAQFSGSGELQNVSNLYSQGNLDEAYRHVSAYLEKHPQGAVGWTLKGKILFTQNHYDEAKAAYLKALEFDPESFSALYSLGRISRAEGNNEAAMVFYKKAIAVNPRYARTYTGMTTIEIERNNFQQALEYAKKAYKYDQNEPVIAANLAVSYHYNGLFEERDRMTETARKLGYDGIENLDLRHLLWKPSTSGVLKRSFSGQSFALTLLFHRKRRRPENLYTIYEEE